MKQQNLFTLLFLSCAFFFLLGYPRAQECKDGRGVAGTYGNKLQFVGGPKVKKPEDPPTNHEAPEDLKDAIPPGFTEWAKADPGEGPVQVSGGGLGFRLDFGYGVMGWVLSEPISVWGGEIEDGGVVSPPPGPDSPLGRMVFRFVLATPGKGAKDGSPPDTKTPDNQDGHGVYTYPPEGGGGDDDPQVPGKPVPLGTPTPVLVTIGNQTYTDYHYPPKLGRQLRYEHVIRGGNVVGRFFSYYPDRTKAEFELEPVASNPKWRLVRMYRGDDQNPDWENTYSYYDTTHHGIKSAVDYRGIRRDFTWTNFGTTQSPIWRITRFTVSSPWGSNLFQTDFYYSNDSARRLVKVVKPARVVWADSNRDGILENLGVRSPTTVYHYKVDGQGNTTDYLEEVVDETLGTGSLSRRILKVTYDTNIPWRVTSLTYGPDNPLGLPGQNPRVHTFSYETVNTQPGQPKRYKTHWTDPTGIQRDYLVEELSGSQNQFLSHISSTRKLLEIKEFPSPNPTGTGLVSHGTLTWTFSYGNCGSCSPTKVTFPNGASMEVQYDAEGRGLVTQRTIRPPLGSSLPVQVATWTWSPWFTSGSQNVDYRMASRLLTFTDPTGRVLNFQRSINSSGEVQTNLSMGPSGNQIPLGTYMEDPKGFLKWMEEAPFSVDGGGTSTNRVEYVLGSSSSQPDYLLPVELKQVQGGVTRKFTFTYEGPGWTKTITDPLGRTTQIQHNVYGDITKAISPNAASGFGTSTIQGVNEFFYDESGLVSRITRLAVKKDGTAYAHQAVERLLIRNPFGEVWREWIDPSPLDGTAPSVNDPNGWMVNEYEWSGSGELVRKERIHGANHYEKIQFYWDAHDRLAKIEKALKPGVLQSNELGFDEWGLLVQSKDSGGLLSFLNRDAYGRIQEVVAPGGESADFSFDSANRLLQVDAKVGGVLKGYRKWIRNGISYRLDRIEDRIPNSTAVRFLAYTYNGWARLSSIQDANGRSRSFYYDAFGRHIRTTDNLQGPGQGNELKKTLDLLGQVLRIDQTLQRETSPGQFQTVTRRTDFAYNEWGDVLEVQRFGTGIQAQAISKRAFDSLGNVVWFQDSVQKQWEWELDALSRVLSTKRIPRGTGNPVTTTTNYNDFPTDPGHALEITRQDGLGHQSKFFYDLGGRLVQRKLPGYDSLGARTWTYEYDAEGRLLSWIDGNGAQVQLGYDAAMRPVSRWLAQMGSQSLSALCTNETFAYDDQHRPYRGTTWWGVFGDTNGPSPSASTLVRAESVWDGFDRLTAEIFGFGDDGNHNPLPQGTKTVASTWTDPQGNEDFGFRRSLQSSSGFKQIFSPDGVGKLSQIDLTGPGGLNLPGFAKYRYEGGGVIHRSIFSNGGTNRLWKTQTFGSLGFLSSIETRWGPGLPTDSLRASLSITRDTQGNVQDLRFTKISGRIGDKFSYDGFDRLKVAELGVDAFTGQPNYDKKIDFTLDDAQNRTSVTTYPGGLTEAYTLVPGTNSYQSAGITQFTYDGNGNLISDGFYVYVYDYLDRLSEVYLITYPAGVTQQSGSKKAFKRPTSKQQRERRGVPSRLSRRQLKTLIEKARARARKFYRPGQTKAPSLINTGLTANAEEPVLEFVAWYGYDTGNRRIWKYTIYENTYFTWDAWNLCDEMDAGYQETKVHFSPGGLSEQLGYAVKTGSTWTRYNLVQDHLGTITKVTDKDGNIVEQYEYDPYGRRSVFDANGNLLSVTAVQNLRGYTSHLHDFETGFIYMRNRYFHPGIGRFLTLDPLGVWYDSGNWGNGYGYGGGNPITIWDPHGEFGLLGLFVGAVVGGLYAAATGGNVLEGALTGAAIGAGVGVGLGALGTGAKIGAAALSGLGAGLSVANAPGAVGRAVDTAGKLLKGKISPTKAALKVGKVAVEQLAWKKVSTAGGWLIKQGQKIPGLKKLCGLLSRWFGKKQKKRLKKKKPRGPPDERGGGILWRSWGGYEKVTVGRREYAKVGDRLYTRHAVDRMQPSGLGTPAGGSGSGRSISPNFVEDVIQNGTARSVTVNGVERTIHTSGSVQVVTEQGGRIVVTVNPFSGGK